MARRFSPRPNVILMTADSLRADHVGCYGAHEAKPSLTPHFDKLAARSALLLNAFSPGPYTAFVMPPLFTGRYPCRLKTMQKTLPLWGLHGTTVEGNVTLTEILQAAGYHTAGFHSNPLISRLSKFQKGFDVFFDDLWLGSSRLPHAVRRVTAQAYRFFRSQPCMSAAGLNERVKAWLERAPEPFFLFIHYMDTHGPYLQRKFLKAISPSERAWRRCSTAPEKITRRQHDRLVRNYRRQVAYLDEQWGNLWQLFENRELFDRSLLIVSADHGEEFREHNGYSHTYKLYDELIRVPMLVHSPETAPGRIEELTGSIQIAPTILEFAGIQPCKAADFDSESFLSLLRGESYGSKQFILSEAGPVPHDHLCVRTKEWKLVWKRAGTVKELYHLVRDPAEKINVASKEPRVVEQLESHIRAHLSSPSVSAVSQSSEPSVAAESSEVDQMIVEERLRDLGYI
jgi:arylsulfatase A-like enzyme